MRITDKQLNVLRELKFHNSQIAILQEIEFTREQFFWLQMPIYSNNKYKLSQKKIDFLKSLNFTREQSNFVQKFNFTNQQIYSLFRFQLTHKQVVFLQGLNLTDKQLDLFRNPDFSIEQIKLIERSILDKRKEEAKLEKEFFETYDRYRDQIKHEDSQANQRLSFFISSQAFLFFPYFTVLRSYKDRNYNNYDTVLLLIICLLGLAISLTMISPLRGFVNASKAISNEWKKTCSNLLPRIILQKYNYKLGNTEDITKQDKNISFLKIPRTGDDKTIPNIWHGNSSFWVNFGFRLTNHISIGFCIIWVLLFLIPSCIFQSKMPNDNQGFEKEVKGIISNNNQELLPKLKQELTKKIYTDQEVIRLKGIVESKDAELREKQSEIDKLTAPTETLENDNNSGTEESEAVNGKEG